MRTSWTSLFGIIALTVMFLPFQACSPVHEGELDLSSGDGLKGSAQSLQIFEATLKPIIRSNCGSCHGTSQLPLFAESDSKSSHDALFTFNLVSLTDPGSSRLVGKVSGGHQGIASSIGTDMQAAIQDWADQLDAGGGGGDDIPPPAVLEATFTSIHNLILVPKCVGCHSPIGTRPQEDYSDYSSTIATGGIAVGNSGGSEMYKECESGSMPESAPALSAEELSVLAQWIDDGAQNN